MAVWPDGELMFAAAGNQGFAVEQIRGNPFVLLTVKLDRGYRLLCSHHYKLAGIFKKYNFKSDLSLKCPFVFYKNT